MLLKQIWLMCGMCILFSALALGAADSIDQHFTESTTFLWTPAQEGVVENIAIDGEITGTGRVRVYLIAGGEQYLIFARTPGQEVLSLEDYVELSEGNAIGLFLEYGDGNWDKNNDGIATTSDGIDYQLNPFIWQDLEEKNFCTLWDVYSIEEDVYTPSCYGSSSCCDFLNYDVRQPDWDRPYVLIYGTDGATDNNLVLARVVYYDGTQVLYSNYDALEGAFVESEASGSVENITREYNSSSHFLRVDLDEDTIFHLKSIQYDLVTKETKEDSTTQVPALNNQDPVAIGEIEQQPSTLKQSPSTFTITIPLLEETETFMFDDSMYVKEATISSQETLEDVVIRGNIELNDGLSQLISFNIPKGVLMELLVEVPTSKINNDPTAFKVERWNGNGWNVTDYSYVKITEDTAVYKVSLQGNQDLFFRALGKTTISQDGIKLNLNIGTFSFFILALIIVGIIFLTYGVKRSYYREIQIGIEERKFSRDAQHVRNILEDLKKI